MRTIAWVSCLSLPALVACGGAVPRAARTSEPPAPTSERPPGPCEGSEGALAELEALHKAQTHEHVEGTDLAGALRAERQVLEAGRARRASSQAANDVFAAAEDDASRRAAALERYATRITEPHLLATADARRLERGCLLERPSTKKARASESEAVRGLECERIAQLSQAVRWDDAASVASFGDAVAATKTLSSERVRETVEHVRALGVALREASADRATFTAPHGELARVEEQASARFTQCKGQPTPASPFVVAADVTARALTVVVRALPPKGLDVQFAQAALAAGKEDAQVYRGVAAGRLGSGFIVVVAGESGARETFVVTNRHVADLSSSLSVKLESGASFQARPLFIDPTYDLAVLSPIDPAQKVGELGGFDISSRPAVDGEEVTATGYPGMLGEPSFQLTRGHISNASLIFPDVRRLVHVQHTAAIDPGSSGGPLLGAHREVLGVNTFKLVGREAVAIAVPASAVARAIRSARAAARCDGDCKQRAAEDACLSLVSELSQPEPSHVTIQRMLGEAIVATHGIKSHDVLVEEDPAIHARFRNSPVATLSEAVAVRMIHDVRDGGGVRPLETCAALRTGSGSASDTVGTSIALNRDRHERRDLRFTWDGSRWRVADFAFREVEAPAPTARKAAAASASKKGKTGTRS
jgi:serine protease Do